MYLYVHIPQLLQSVEEEDRRRRRITWSRPRHCIGWSIRIIVREVNTDSKDEDMCTSWIMNMI